MEDHGILKSPLNVKEGSRLMERWNLSNGEVCESAERINSAKHDFDLIYGITA